MAGAINLLMQTHPINSALSLVVVMGKSLRPASIFYWGAEFVAAVQVIVYAGAIMVLFVITIMPPNAGSRRTDWAGIAALRLCLVSSLGVDRWSADWLDASPSRQFADGADRRAQG